MTSAVKDTVNNLLERLHLSPTSSSASPPKEPTTEEFKEIQSKYEDAGQAHVFTFWEELSSADKGSLYQQLNAIDPKHINEITKRALNPPPSKEGGDKLDPLPDSATSSIIDSNEDDLSNWYNAGLNYIAENKVGVVLMAGGQGTRLGSSAPKGCFDIGLPSHKSLFQLQAERILSTQRLAAKKAGKTGEEADKIIVPWYVMTSGPTREPTEKFFMDNNFFGLKKENVIVFEQGTLPCISNDEKIIMETKGKVGIFVESIIASAPAWSLWLKETYRSQWHQMAMAVYTKLSSLPR